jgi:hypothetical protein
MNDEDQKRALAEYRRERKQWTNRRLKERKRNTKNVYAEADAFSGDATPTLQVMNVVEELRLNAGDTFPTKEILQIRIAEEINLRKIATAMLRSDLYQLLVVGNDFYVKASCRDSVVWKVSTCIVRSEDGAMPDNKYTFEYAAKTAAAATAAAAAAAAIVDAADEPRDDMDDQMSVMDSGKVNDDENGGNVPAKLRL